MTNRALAAIVSARLRAERRTAIFASCAAVIVGFIQPHGIAAITDPLSADLATRSVWLAGPMFFCSTIGIIAALMQGPGRHEQLDLTEQSAPLFGRELARSKAIVPAAIATIATFAYWFAQFLSGFAMPPTFFVLALASVLASTLVALNATVRTGAARSVYILFAFATTVVSYAFAVYSDALHMHWRGTLATYGDALGVGTELIFCGIVGFIALRQYGEGLAERRGLLDIETSFP
jgi:hypothetical protein